MSGSPCHSDCREPGCDWPRYCRADLSARATTLAHAAGVGALLDGSPAPATEERRVLARGWILVEVDGGKVQWGTLAERREDLGSPSPRRFKVEYVELITATPPESGKEER